MPDSAAARAPPAMLPDPLPRCFAHRCGGVLAPENTLLGLTRAAAAGFLAVEFDVMLSADGTPVLIHDETLERTTNGRGAVAETPDRVLRTLDAGAGEAIPTLAEAAALCRALGLYANVEIKPAAGLAARTGAVVGAAARALWRGAPPPLLSSFVPDALVAAREQAPELPRGLLLEAGEPGWAALAGALGAATLHLAADAADDAILARAARLGLPVLCYTVNDPRLATRLFARGVAAVFTDAPAPISA